MTKAEKQKLRIKGGVVTKCFRFGGNFCFLIVVITAVTIVISLPVFIKHSPAHRGHFPGSKLSQYLGSGAARVRETWV